MMKSFKEFVIERIVKSGSGYEVKSEHGNKNLGKTKTLAGAKKRLGQIEYFKHVKEDGVGVGAVAGSGAASLPADQREPGVSKKRNPVMMAVARRKAPKL